MDANSDSPVHNVWKPDLYRMQLAAPTPVTVPCSTRRSADRPDLFGTDFHGTISSRQAEQLLETVRDGGYLVRTSPSAGGEFYTLSLKFAGKVHHYKLFCDASGALYVREKRYDSVRSLVADGLVTMYIESRAPLLIQHLSTVCYNESPYMTLNKRKLRALSREHSRSSGRRSAAEAARNAARALDAAPDTPDGPEKHDKSHLFKVNTFKGLHWCELCGNFLWGFKAQGVKCEDCGFIAHAKCSERVPSDCVPDIKHMRGVFGIDLTTLLAAHGAALPFVVTKCAAEVEARGLLSEGIYRLSGFADEIDALKTALDKDGEAADLSEDAYGNINVVAGALKLYLRLLPIPLVTFNVRPLLVQATAPRDLQEQLAQLALAVRQLPKTHHTTFKYMMEHLNRVSRHQAINKMNARNLATVFAPTLIGAVSDPGSGPPDLSTDIFLLETIITHCDQLFGKN